MPAFTDKFLRLMRHGALAAAAMTLAGCAQQRNPDYYAVGRDTTLSDAQQQAQGSAPSARAPSQIQLGFGDQRRKPKGDQPSPQDVAQAELRAATRPLLEAKTFLGTIPCLSSPDTCSAARITLTLAPSGEWRARTVALDPAAGAHGKSVQQGCWAVIGTGPLKILLQLKNDTPKASLTFVNDNVLRINTVNGVAPNLEYRLTRQAEIDGINELHDQPALKCPKR